MAVPVVQSFTYNTAGSATTSVDLTKPSGVQVGDLLIMLVGNEDNTATTSFAAITGWTKSYEHGDSTPDTKIGMYWRIADGTEGATETIDWSATSTDFGGGWYLRITGHDSDTPIHILGSSQQSAGTSSLASLSVTTTLDDCLVFSHMSGDGGDTYPFSSSGTGWPTSIPTNQELQDTTATSAWAGAWVTRSLATAGASNNHTWGMNVSDGIVTKQFAVAPIQEGIQSVSPTEFDMDEASVTISGLEFSASGNSVYISTADTLTGSPTPQSVDISSAINTESTTSINLDFTQLSAAELTSLHTVGPGQRYVIVVTSSSPQSEYGSPVITLHRPDAFIMSLSSNFAPGTTTQRLTGLTGTFAGGRIEEALNPSTTNTDVATDGNREDVWNIQAKALSREVSYDFRVLYGGNVPDTITQTPQVTVTSVVSYTLTADAGTYTYTGTAANLEYSRILDAGSGAYTYSGIDSNLEYGRVLASDAGAYVYSGSDATLKHDWLIDSESGSYTYSGTDANLEHAYILDSEAGSYTYAGQTADLSYGLAVIASSGSYVYTGQDATLTYVPAGGYSLTAEAGNYAYSGQAANLQLDRLLDAAASAYSYTGQDAQLVHEWLLDAGLGTYSYTGQNADLIYTPVGAYILTADPGSYAYSGQEAGFLYSRVFGADAGSYIYTGQQNNLYYGRLISAESGSYTYTGQTSDFLYSRVFDVESGAYLYTGNDVDLQWSGATGPEEPGLEYSFLANKLHYSVNTNGIHYHLDINRIHYNFREE